MIFPHLVLGEETSQLCIEFAVDQVRTATSSCGLSSFLSSLLSPEVFMGLGVRDQR